MEAASAAGLAVTGAAGPVAGPHGQPEAGTAAFHFQTGGPFPLGPTPDPGAPSAPVPLTFRSAATAIRGAASTTLRALVAPLTSTSATQVSPVGKPALAPSFPVGFPTGGASYAPTSLSAQHPAAVPPRRPPVVAAGGSGPGLWGLAAATPTPVVGLAGLKAMWTANQDPDNPRPDFWSLPGADAVTQPSFDQLQGSFDTAWLAAEEADRQNEERKKLAEAAKAEKALTPIKAPDGGSLSDYIAGGGSLEALMADSPDSADSPDEEAVVFRPPELSTDQGPADEPVTALTIDEIRDELADEPPARWMNLDDPDDYDELADRLYNTLSSRLRFDVLVERERSGTLLDFG